MACFWSIYAILAGTNDNRKRLGLANTSAIIADPISACWSPSTIWLWWHGVLWCCIIARSYLISHLGRVSKMFKELSSVDLFLSAEIGNYVAFKRIFRDSFGLWIIFWGAHHVLQNTIFPVFTINAPGFESPPSLTHPQSRWNLKWRTKRWALFAVWE